MAMAVRVRVEKPDRLIVHGGDAAAREIVFAAARASRGDDTSLVFVSDGADALRVTTNARFRATPAQLDRILMVCANTGRDAAIDALRAAGYAVD